eukprot:502493-Rhodomonas_salina.1
MDPRDTLPGGRYIYELELSYAFEQSEKELVKVRRAPDPPARNSSLHTPSASATRSTRSCALLSMVSER